MAELQTSEQVAAQVAAMEREKEGIQVRLSNVKVGTKDPVNASQEVLEARLKHIDVELKRAKGLLGKADKAEPAAE